MSFWSSFLGQFRTLPWPAEDCSGRSVIVTGANTGLGREAARHFVRLNAAKVILACRSIDKGEDAKKEIESSTQRHGVVEVWQLDLVSFASVKDFAARAAGLDRLDVLLNNASTLVFDWAIMEGHETMMTVNIISTYLLTALLLPILRHTGTRFNVTSRVVIVSSEGAFLTHFPERNAEHVFNELKINKNYAERYNTTKLIQLILMRKLAHSLDASGKGHVLVNALNPGFCRTELFRCIAFPGTLLRPIAFLLFGRNAEMGSRTLMAAALAGEETHGQWMSNCELHVWPSLMNGDAGRKLEEKLWAELLDVLEAIEPGVADNI